MFHQGLRMIVCTAVNYMHAIKPEHNSFNLSQISYDRYTELGAW